MIDAYVINLKSRTDRLEFALDQAAKLGLDLHRIEAVNGKLLNLSTLRLSVRAQTALRSGRTFPFSIDSAGAVGASLSHKAAWELVAKSGKSALILEDDATLRSSPKAVHNAIAKFKELKLEFAWLCAFQTTYVTAHGLEAFQPWTRTFASKPNGSQAYLLTPSFARSLVERFELDVAIDFFLQAQVEAHGLHNVCFPCFGQGVGGADIEHVDELVCFPVSTRMKRACYALAMSVIAWIAWLIIRPSTSATSLPSCHPCQA